MAKIYLSVGFWMTFVLFIALGYAFGSECPGVMGCENRHAAFRPSVIQDENPILDNDMLISERFPHSNCPSNPTLRSYDPDFTQMANLQQGGPTYAPGFSLTIARRPPEVSLCPGAIEIPRH
jgi:hypothetical protein